MQSLSPYKVDLHAVEQIRNGVSTLFNTADTRFDEPEPGAFRLRGRINWNPDIEDGFVEIQEVFKRFGFTVFLRQEDGHTFLVGMPFLHEPRTERRWGWAIGLFVATVLSTLFVGVIREDVVVELLMVAPQEEIFFIILRNLWRGWPFSVTIISILLAHELGHFFAALYHKTPASLPFFLPLPFSGIGTLGAFIVQRGPTRNVRAQFDFGASGPLCGLVVAIPILIYGLATSDICPVPPITIDVSQVPEECLSISLLTEGTFIVEGNSLLYAGIKTLVFGQYLPADGNDVFLNSFAWGGWVGLLVTMLNLIPVSPFDGGRVLQVLVGERMMRRLYMPIILITLLMGIFSFNWLIWAALFYFLGGKYETPLDSVTPLDNRRRALAWLIIILFVLLFMPIPLEQVTF